MKLTPVESAEKEYLQILERYFVSIYDEKKLPSHGLSHHRRVWTNAKKLLLNLPHGYAINPRLPYTLIIASYMHDLGMTLDHGPKHGRQSMELCRTFLSNHQLDEADFPELLHSIQEHDNKNYSSSAGINALSILSMADDLDAFGFTGIYRYTEIYLLRGIDVVNLGSKIRPNAKQRFEHFKNMFENSGKFYDEQERRYRILDSFFDQYDREISSAAKEKEMHYAGVIRMMTEIISEHRNITDISISDHAQNPVAAWFFRGISEEMGNY